MNKIKNWLSAIILVVVISSCQKEEEDHSRQVITWTNGWHFALSATIPKSEEEWRVLDLPHDWSIEGTFSPDHPAGVGGGALPGGVGWYKKTFIKPLDYKKVFLQFDGVYQNSTVWVNGDSVGNRPNGYISFGYDISAFLTKGENEILVKVANAPQPNSRWYSGSGIYREVRLVYTNEVYVPNCGVYLRPELDKDLGKVLTEVKFNNDQDETVPVTLTQEVFDQNGNSVRVISEELTVQGHSQSTVSQSISIVNPSLWDIENPSLYRLKVTLATKEEIIDDYEETFGFRTIHFDVEKGFFLNGEQVKIQGVCLHHDLGALGTAFNRRAAERQLEIMQGMGVNAVRTAHNPPAPEFLDLCDEMGILVMDEMFDMWANGKTEFDYSTFWDQWHERDLTDFVLRDRNHPSVIVWSIGNEIKEQYNHEDSIGGVITQELADIVRALDPTRPITTANNDISVENPLIKYGGLDMLGYNYHHDYFEKVPVDHPGKQFIVTESHSSLATRGHYDMPSDSVKIWPVSWDQKFLDGNPDFTVSAYDHVRTPWGSTQEDTWRITKQNDFISGFFIWTGFDYIGEPTPYEWPARSSYFGIVDLAGFPKDTYFMYQSEWTSDTVLHVFPHWNWEASQEIDLWAYYNHADEAELFVNGTSQGVKRKGEDDFHVMWRVIYEPGEIKVITRKGKEVVLSKTIQTAGEPATMTLEADRDEIYADGKDLSFVTVTIHDANGIIVPYAKNLVEFEVRGSGKIVGVDNGDPTSHLSLKGHQMKAMAGKCLVIVQSTETAGSVELLSKSEGLKPAKIEINTVLKY